MISLNKKTVIITVAIVFLVALSFTVYTFLNSSKGFEILINNNTNKEISGLNITYNNITKDITVPNILPQSNFKFNINPKENFGENTMKMYYYDKTNKKHEEILVGYFEKGYRGKVYIEINSINDNGKLEVKVDQK